MEEKRRKGYRNGLWAVVFLAVLAALVFFLYHTGFFASVRSLDDMREYIARFSPYSYGVYFLVQLLSVVAAPIPSNVTSLAGAAVFGTLVAFLLTYAAVALGSLLVFQLTRRLGRPFAERFVSRGNMDKYRDMIERKQDVFFAMAFLLPGFPDDILVLSGRAYDDAAQAVLPFGAAVPAVGAAGVLCGRRQCAGASQLGFWCSCVPPAQRCS